MAIEKHTRKVLKEDLFASEMNKKQLEFKSLNSENSVHKKLVKEFGISGSALIVIKKGEKVDLTNQAFLYARTQHEKFKEILRETLK